MGDVIVPLLGGSCGSCHTSVPLNRRSQIRAGSVLENCEVCGAILYPSESGRSAE
jgi:predicted  nucleic acid-binding Zn-ribbon protein